MKLIKEKVEDTRVNIQEKEDGTKDYYIEGIFLQAEKKNKNGRIYPKSILENEIQRYIAEEVNQNRALGELGHPDGPEINFERASHKIVEIRENGNDFVGKAKILDTPNGKIVKNLIDENVAFGVSSRGLGSLKEENGVNYVQKDFRLATAADIVQNPSAPDAWVEGIMEGAEWVWENGMLRQIDDPEQYMENTRKRILKAKKSQLEEQKMKEFENFLKKL